MSDDPEKETLSEGRGADTPSLSLRTGLLLLIGSAFLRFLSHPPLQVEAAAWVALVGFLFYVNAVRSWTWLLVGSGLWGFFFFLPSLAWLRHIAVPAWIGLSGLMALFPVFFVVLLKTLAPAPGVRQGVVGGFCWVVSEYTRTHFLSGFPYLFLAHSQADLLPLIQVADVTGAWGVSLMIFWVNAAVFMVLYPLVRPYLDGLEPIRTARSRIWIASGIAVLLPICALVYGFRTLQTTSADTGPRIGVIQGNVPQSVRKRQSPETLFRLHAALAEQVSGRAGLVVWPETMYPHSVGVTRDGVARSRPPEPLEELIDRVTAPQLIGGHTLKEREEGVDIYNSAWLVTDEGLDQHYFKYHLVPFGEYIPGHTLLPFLDPIVDRVFPYAADITWLSAGPPPEKSRPMTWRGPSFVPMICYEVVFPDEFRTRVNRGASFVINMSNEAWYRNEAELDQMLSIVRYRAVENRISVVRSTNTGISGFIFPSGRQHLLRGPGGEVRGVRGTMVDRIRKKGSSTVYRLYGDWLPLGAIGVLILLFIQFLVNVTIQEK